MAERFDRIWHNARLATMRADRPDLGEIEHGVIAARGGHIVYAGAAADFPVMRMRPNGSIARGVGSRPASSIAIPISSMAATARMNSSCA